jgi:uncharacterized protein
MAKKIFVNLPIKDLEKSKIFFTALGFTFNEQFSDTTGTCLVISDDIYCMLLTESKFKSFTKKEIPDASTAKEAIIAVSMDNREQVEEIFNKAMTAGAKESRPAEDYGWMYLRSIEDLDNHSWEFFFMDEKAAAEAAQAGQGQQAGSKTK